jgi:hypothetical protein
MGEGAIHAPQAGNTGPAFSVRRAFSDLRRANPLKPKPRFENQLLAPLNHFCECGGVRLNLIIATRVVRAVAFHLCSLLSVAMAHSPARARVDHFSNGVYAL